MKNKELDFDIKIGLNKVEENITNLTDKERERVISDLENGMGPDDIILYMNQFRGNDKNLNYVMDMVEKGISVSAAVRITKKYCSDNTIDAVFTCMENGMPIAVIEKEYSRKSFISRMMHYMESVKDLHINEEKEDYDEEPEYCSDEEDINLGRDLINNFEYHNKDYVVQACIGEEDNEGHLFIPYVSEPSEINLIEAFRLGAKVLFKNIPTVEKIHVYIGASEKMLDDLIDLPLNLQDDKIIKYHREDFLKDEE